ncbi:MAG: carboxypeptidase regulatory-like domain-containing protein [Candidatus Micrarchaeota archaeon]
MRMEMPESLNELYHKLEDGYYSFCDYLEKEVKVPIYELFINPIEDKGIPSFPVVIAIFLILVVGGFFLATSMQSTSLKVVVTADGAKINGAQVVLTADGLSKQLNTENGLAEFKQLPKGKKARLTVTKEGYIPVEKNITLGIADTLPIRLFSETGVAVEIATVDFDGAPLPGVVLSYSYTENNEEKTGSATTDSSGKATITAAEKSEVSLTASLAGYETKSTTFTVEKGMGVKRIILKKIEATTQPPNGANSQLTILLKDKDDGSAIEGTVKIYDSKTQALLKTGATEFGAYETDEFQIGESLKISGEAEGYEKNYITKTLTAKPTYSISLNRVSGNTTVNTSEVVIRAIDEKNASALSEIRLWERSPEGNYTLSEIRKSATELRKAVNSMGRYYATAFKEGFLPGRTLEFLGGSEKTIVLAKADGNNSVNLTINTIDEDGKKIISANLGFMDEFGQPVAPFDLKTDTAKGRIVIKNFPKGRFTIVASKGGFYGEQAVDISSSMEVNLTLLSPRGTIIFSATDWDTNATIDILSVKLSYKDANKTLYRECSSTDGNCSMSVRADKDFQYSITSPNYENASRPIKATAGLTKYESVALMHLGGNAVSRIRFDKIVDLDYNETRNLTSDDYYIAVFDIYAKDTVQNHGAYLRIEGGDRSEIAHVVNASFEGNLPSEVEGGEHLDGYEECESAYDPAAGEYPLAWLNAEYSFRGSSKISFLFKIDPSINTDKLVLHFRSYAVSQGEYFRDPPDPYLGFLRETANKSWCSANTKNASYGVKACGSFGEVCCKTRGNENQGRDGACNNNLQCVVLEGDNAGTCANPTMCGSQINYCVDNAVCCEKDGAKQCVASNQCAASNLRECTPACKPKTEYCDSSGAGAATCRPIATICGKEGQMCCPEQNAQCGAGLTCTSDKCVSCGQLDQSCCPFSESNPRTACIPALWCNTFLGSPTCGNAVSCGSMPNICTGATVCCRDAGKVGQCTPYSQCNNPSYCNPACEFDEHCNSVNLNNPFCESCISNPGSCHWGALGELCDKTNSSHKCANGACVIPEGRTIGICSACGKFGQPCCDSEPLCKEPEGLVCKTDNVPPMCVWGTKDCSNNGEMCVEITKFEQRQCDPSEIICTITSSTRSGFNVQALDSCNRECDTRDLVLYYKITEASSALLPGDLVITVSDPAAIALKSTTIMGETRLINNPETVTIHIDRSGRLTGLIKATPLLPKGRVSISLTYSHNSSTPAVSISPYLAILSNKPITPPTELPNMFETNYLILENKQLEGLPNGRLTSNADRVVFTVDSFFPADAIPMNTTGLASCGVYTIQFGTDAAPDKYQKCFVYKKLELGGTYGGGEALRYWPTKNPACPAELKPFGNYVPGAEIAMRVKCQSNGQEKLINITIANFTLASGFNAIDIGIVPYKKSPYLLNNLPLSYYGYNRESRSGLRLLYALNNRARTADEGDFNSNDNFWISDYIAKPGGFEKGGESSRLLAKQYRADLLGWDIYATADSKQTAIIDVYADPSQSEFASNKPPKILSATIATSDKDLDRLTTPNQGLFEGNGEHIPSLTYYLISQAMGNSGGEFDAYYSEQNACINGCDNEQTACQTTCVSEEESCIYGCSPHPSPDPGCYDYCTEEYNDCVKHYGASTLCTDEYAVCNAHCMPLQPTPEPTCVFGCEKHYKSCDSDCIKENAACRPSCTKDAENTLDKIFAKAIVREFQETAKDVARKTIFKRSFENTFYCTKPAEDVTIQDTQDSSTCRSSISAWIRIEKNERTFEEACTFCNDLINQTYGIPDDGILDNLDNCDIRCQEDSTPECALAGSTGYCAEVVAGDTYVDANGEMHTCAEEQVGQTIPYGGTYVDENGDEQTCGDQAGCVDYWTDDGVSTCLYSCGLKSITQNGDYCGDPEECGACETDGMRNNTLLEGYYFTWENASALNNVVLPLPVGEQVQAQSPYKYFVSDADATPFVFSAVLPLDANVVYARFRDPLDFNSAQKNLISFGQITEACKVRQGVYLMQTQTSNGLSFKYGAKDVGLNPLYVNENYPNIQGAGQDFCGTVIACNLFDASTVQILGGHSYLKKNVFPESTYISPCFTWEWPIVPTGLFSRDYCGVSNTGLQTSNCFFQYPSAQNESLSDSYTVWFKYMKKDGKCGTSGRYRDWYFGWVNPYDLAKYPDVFSEGSTKCNDCAFRGCTASSPAGTLNR